MTLYVCYNDNCSDFLKSIKELCSSNFPDITIIDYNENDYREKRKAYKLKGGYSARMTPFMLLLEDKTCVKAFYSEDNGCTIDKLIQFLNTNSNESKSN